MSRLKRRLGEGDYSEYWLDLYLERAKQLGIGEVGILDHLYRFRDALDYYQRHVYLESDKLGDMQRRWLGQVCVVPCMDKFIDFVQSQKERWADHGVQLRLGIEADFFPNGEDELAKLIRGKPWDYVIGSVHFVNGWGFDNIETEYIFERVNLMELYRTHTSHVCQAIESELFDIVAHLDNLKVFGYRPNERLLQGLYEQVASALKKHDVATELNTGLSYRAPVEEACPSPNYLRTLAKYEIPITLSSDAHYPDRLGTELDLAKEQLRKCGYKALAALSGRKRYYVPV